MDRALCLARDACEAKAGRDLLDDGLPGRVLESSLKGVLRSSSGGLAWSSFVPGRLPKNMPRNSSESA